MKLSNALAVLMRGARADASPMVRRRAVEALAENPAGVSLETLTSIAESDPDGDVRYASLVGIVRQANSNPRARAFLERRAVEEPSQDIRQFLQQVLGSGV